MTPGLRENREAGPNDHRWTIRVDARDTDPKRNRDAIRFGIRILLRDRFDISIRDITTDALIELELRLEELMLGDGYYVPFSEECGRPLLTLARLPVGMSVVSVRPKHPSERRLERHARAFAELDGVLGAEVRHEILGYCQ